MRGIVYNTTSNLYVVGLVDPGALGHHDRHRRVVRLVRVRVRGRGLGIGINPIVTLQKTVTEFDRRNWYKVVAMHCKVTKYRTSPYLGVHPLVEAEGGVRGVVQARPVRAVQRVEVGRGVARCEEHGEPVEAGAECAPAAGLEVGEADRQDPLERDHLQHAWAQTLKSL